MGSGGLTFDILEVFVHHSCYSLTQILKLFPHALLVVIGEGDGGLSYEGLNGGEGNHLTLRVFMVKVVFAALRASKGAGALGGLAYINAGGVTARAGQIHCEWIEIK